MNIRLGFISSLVIFCSLNLVQAQTSFFVSTKGNDANPGTLQKPFATLYKARDVVRTIKSSKSGPITVFIRGGYYDMTLPIMLDSIDSGKKLAPIIIASYHNERVILTGGKRIDSFFMVSDSGVSGMFKPVVRNFIKEIDLKKYGISDFGQIVRRGFGLGDNISGMELFVNDTPMTLARWPNSGWVLIDSVPNADHSDRFYFYNEYINRWEKNNDQWIHGYWKWDWADSYERVKFIDTSTHSIETYPPHGVYGYTKGKRFYFLNVPEELDTIGEWYLDREHGMIYFYQDPRQIDTSIFISVSAKPLVIFNNVSNVIFKNIEVSYGRSSGIMIVGGSSVTIDGCSIQNMGTAGIVIQGGINHRIVSCTIKETGNEGIIVSGGERRTLSSSYHRVTNTSISRFGRWSRAYHPGISVSGVGVTIANNEIYDAPHSAMIVSGNDHHIEYNDIHDVCTETIDAGAIMMGRDLSARGIVIRYNKFSNITRKVQKTSAADVNGIFLDDFFSGVIIYGNIFQNVQRGIEIACGRDNAVENNIFVNCSTAVYFTKRGWDGKNNWDYGELGATVTKNLNTVPFQSKIWKKRYPALANILDDQFGIPKRNRIVNNKYANSYFLESFPESTDSLLFSKNNNSVEISTLASKEVDTIGFLNAYRMNGFHPVPIDKIGKKNLQKY